MEIYASLLREIGIDICSEDVPVVPCSPARNSLLHHPREFDPSYSFDDLSKTRPLGCGSYKKINHFTARLYQLMGCITTEVPEEILTYVHRRLLVPITHPNIYYEIRRILKGIREPSYYNLIFTIVRELGGPGLHVPYDQQHIMFRQFDAMHSKWVSSAHCRGERLYFPSYYLILAVLLDTNNIPIPFMLPSVRNSGKLDRLRQLVDDLMV